MDSTGRLIFLSLFLGLGSGKQPVELRADAGIRSIVLMLDSQQVARLETKPWRTVVDFGAVLIPRQLTAIAFDAQGHEVSRGYGVFEEAGNKEGPVMSPVLASPAIRMERSQTPAPCRGLAQTAIVFRCSMINS